MKDYYFRIFFRFVILGYELLLLVNSFVQSLEFILVTSMLPDFEDIKCGVVGEIYADERFCLYYVRCSE
jgi:hypothetical protein